MSFGRRSHVLVLGCCVFSSSLGFDSDVVQHGPLGLLLSDLPEGDCRCDVHRGWYMWICWKRNGKRIKTEYGHQFNCHGLTKPAPPPPPPPPPPTYASPQHPEYRVLNPKLVNASSAPLMTFHLYRVHSDANYSCCANADLTTAGAALFYLHNEIVWHAKSRAGTNFADPKTRIRRYKVWTRATQPLFDLGMNFGVAASELPNDSALFVSSKQFIVGSAWARS